MSEQQQQEQKEQLNNNDQAVNLKQLKQIIIDKIKQYLTINLSKKLIILIDSIDRLYEENPDYTWIIHDLPKYVKFIYTTYFIPDGSSLSSSANGISNDIEGQLLAEHAFKLDVYGFHKINLRDFEDNECMEIMIDLLKQTNRQLTDQQKNDLKNSFEKFKLTPLYLRLVFNLCNKWPSCYRADVEFRFTSTLKDLIKYYFDRLEKLYGRLILSKVFFYLTLFKYGINEAQLIDILNNDVEINDEIALKQQQQQQGGNNNNNKVIMQTFPTLYWLRIKHDLNDFIIEKIFDGVTVICW